MIRKYHNHKLQTTPWHCEEQPHNNYETPVLRHKAGQEGRGEILLENSFMR